MFDKVKYLRDEVKELDAKVDELKLKIEVHDNGNIDDFANIENMISEINGKIIGINNDIDKTDKIFWKAFIANVILTLVCLAISITVSFVIFFKIKSMFCF